MKRCLMIALAGAALTFLIPSAKASAADAHHGGGHVYNGGLGHVGHGGSHSGYGYTGGHRYYGGHGITGHYYATPFYGSAFRGHYAAGYRSYRTASRSHGGVHLDVGRLHLGAGGDH